MLVTSKNGNGFLAIIAIPLKELEINYLTMFAWPANNKSNNYGTK
jgi:hypothetical protein